ncbi:MAG: replication initiator protein A [Marinobacter nauticus]
MVGEMSNEQSRSPLLPDRHRTPDFFVCDIFDAAPKGDMASMEHPIFSLSTKPDHRIRRYEHGKDWVEVKPSADGLATIHDRDILIYCISQLIAALNSGREVSQTVRFRAHDLLVATNRMTNGRGYEGLKAALERLGGTRISTNIVTGDEEIFENFGLIERSRIVRETRDGRMQEVEVKLSDWVFNAIRHNEVLTLHRDYFRLRKPIERRIYELARKHCGHQASWRIYLSNLQKKCGSSSTEKEFRRLVRKIVDEDQAHQHLPDYSITIDDKDIITFHNRRTMPALKKPQGGRDRQTAVPGRSGSLQLGPDVHEQARQIAPGWDVYELEREWRNWVSMADGDLPTNPDAAFLGFCRKWRDRRGTP